MRLTKNGKKNAKAASEHFWMIIFVSTFFLSLIASFCLQSNLVSYELQENSFNMSKTTLAREHLR